MQYHIDVLTDYKPIYEATLNRNAREQNILTSMFNNNFRLKRISIV